ncbi:GMC oxidoreductase [Actinomycetospora lemnae]|uniref:GMC family oxidoreductase n=1 Tax=Actinomycetospora lemnae TaxID=3019891 RepID=A0ABT5SY89_9PSEU|nr:GMC family oxidoreductase [Actinomycetospora sp. DW7H6]MDD7967830.1 GMC family oxidoreductase [Actinomycetospora sp. DW7H6]
MSDHYDVIVIGSGAGGGTLVHALAPTGKRILLLERGERLPREIENWDPASVWLDGRYSNSGTWTDATTGKRFTPKQHYYVGGNTKVYGAILFRMRERDFGVVAHVDGVSPAWPLSYTDFEPYYTRAEQLYQVHGRRGVDPTDPPSASPYPYPPISHEPRIAQLEDDLTRIGLHPFPLPNGILMDEAAMQTSPCVRCATCDGYPCITNGKADAQTICVEPALRHPNVTLLTGARVTRLETDPSGRTVDRVVVERDGAREEYSADIVAVAGGAINSAALLLRSASDTHPAGLGNGSGVVGRHLMMHNNSSLIAFSTVPNPTKFQKTLGINDYYFDDGDGGPPLGAMQMLGKSDATLIGFDAPEAEDPADLARHAMDFWLTTEDLPLPGNQVVVDGDGDISLRYTPTNLDAHRRLREKFTGLLSSIRCREEVLEGYGYRGGRLGISGVAHQNGTVRFGADPAGSALDRDCRMHELDNLYVVDSSFFVSSSAVNPTLTIIANALRVADHLVDRLDAHVPAQRGVPVGVS